MRPRDDHTGAAVYECFECGARMEGPGWCPSCGGELRNIGRARDL